MAKLINKSFYTKFAIVVLTRYERLEYSPPDKKVGAKAWHIVPFYYKFRILYLRITYA